MVEPTFRGEVNGYALENLNFYKENLRSPLDYEETQFYCKAQIDREYSERKFPIQGRRIYIPEHRPSEYISCRSNTNCFSEHKERVEVQNCCGPENRYYNRNFYPAIVETCIEIPEVLKRREEFGGESCSPVNREAFCKAHLSNNQFCRRNLRDSDYFYPVKEAESCFGTQVGQHCLKRPLQTNGICIKQATIPQCVVNECTFHNPCLCTENLRTEIKYEESVKNTSKANSYPIKRYTAQRTKKLEQFEKKKIVEPKTEPTTSSQKKDLKKPLAKSPNKLIPEKVFKLPKPSRIETKPKPLKAEKPIKKRIEIEKPVTKSPAKKKERLPKPIPRLEGLVIEIPIVMAPKKIQSPKTSQISQSKSIMTETLEQGSQNTQSKPNATSSQTLVNEKILKHHCSHQKCSRPNLCVCSCCSASATRCCCAKVIEGIQKERNPFDMTCRSYTDFKHSHSCQQCKPPQRPCDEEDPCGEFFDIMRETMEDAVKKSFEDVFSRYFASCVKKMDRLSCQIERTECLLKNICNDLNGRICFYGRRSAQQFQHIYLQLEHQKHLFQKQQQCFRKGHSRKPRSREDCEHNHTNSSEDLASETCVSCERLLPRVQAVPSNSDNNCDDIRCHNWRGLESHKSRSSQDSKYEDAEGFDGLKLSRDHLKSSQSSLTRSRSNGKMIHKSSSTGSRGLMQTRSRLQI